MTALMRWVVPEDVMSPSLLDRVRIASEEARLYEWAAHYAAHAVVQQEEYQTEMERRLRWLSSPPCTECGRTLAECIDHIQCCGKCWHYR